MKIFLSYKSILLRILFTLLTFSALSGYSQPCPAWGNAVEGSTRGNLNVYKNHDVSITSETAQQVLLSDLLATPQGDDRDRFVNGTYIFTEGYLVSYKEEGPESCNCKEANADQKTGDVHIYIGQSPDAPKRDCIIVEITPAFKKLHPGYESLLVVGEHVRITGYLLYDFEHLSNSANTCTKCSEVWRKTCWEIHPIVNIEQLN